MALLDRIHASLAQPLTLPCGAVLPNRFSKAAMTEQMADPATNSPNARHERLYARWASSGCGMLLTGNVMVDRVCMENLRNVAVEDDRDLEGLRRWADAAQGGNDPAGGAHLWMQISHAGRQSPKKVTRQPVAPSAVPLQRKSLRSIFAPPRALTPAEIEHLIEAFARTAAIAQAAGFKGVQIHSAHGYLCSEFLSPITNQRTDDWGGTPEKRRRFLLAVIAATRARVGADYPVGVKLNSADFQRGGFSEDESMAVVQALDEAGVDLIEISGGNYENPAMLPARPSTKAREAYFLEYAEKVRAVSRVPLMLTGGFRTAPAMCEALESGTVDVVGLARPLCVQPDLAARLLDGTCDHAPPITIATGIRLFDDMLQSFWFNHQMRRMADGLDPNPAASKWRILARGLAEQAIANPFTPTRAYPAGGAGVG